MFEESPDVAMVSRRDLLKGLGAVGVGAALLPALGTLGLPGTSHAVALAQTVESTPVSTATPVPPTATAVPASLESSSGLRKRSEIPPQYTWDLSPLYPDDARWEADFQAVKDALPKLQGMEGHLGDSPDSLLSFFRLSDETSERVNRVYVYARMKQDEDNANSRYQGMADTASTLYTEFGAALAFTAPEILAVPEEKLWGFVAAEPGLGVYRHALDGLLRSKAHVRSAEVEAVLALAADVGEGPSKIFGMMDDADLKFPSITDEDGQPVQLSRARYERYRSSPDRRVRKDAFEAFHQAYHGFRNTLAACLSAEVKAHIFGAKTRNYSSSLDASLDANNIPVEVYYNLLRSVEQGLPSLHRYMALRKRMLNLEELHHYDLYVPMVPDVDMKVSFDEASRIVVEALAPLGAEYVATVKTALSSRWIDVYETEGKTSGGYSWGAYRTAPFILLNHEDTLEDMYTLAHELGHSMHSYFTWKSQPYLYGDYALFLGEVASTTNEVLLTEYLLKKYPTRELQLYITNRYLETFRTAFFRQTMFAEFELETHKRAEEGEALTPDLLSTLYRELNAKYYGPGVVLDEGISIEWARIPHFYRNFYVYQYATGLASAASFGQRILADGEPAVQQYFRLLNGGSSDYPLQLLKSAGVDMSTSEPIEEALRSFDRLLDQMEGKA